MTAKMLRASPLSIAVALVVAAVAIIGFVLTSHNESQQNQRLLRDQTAQAALIGSSEFNDIVSEFTGLIGPVAEFSPGSLQTTATAVASATPSDRLVIDVFRSTPTGFQAIAAAGPGISRGQFSQGQMTATLDAAMAASSSAGSLGSPYVPAPVMASGSSSTIGFASRVSGSTDEVVYFSFTFDPYSAARTLVQNRGPFELLRLALYGSPKAESTSVVVATTHQLPLTGDVAKKTFAVGTRYWLIVAQARSPLAGSFAAAAPWFILGLGLILALLIAGTVEVLVRRQRYANDLVAVRTAELETSLSELRTAQDKLVQSERLAALGEMASVVGHELRNPLTAVMNALFLLRRGIAQPVSESVDKHLDMAERETAKAATLAEDLTSFVRPRNPVMAEVDVEELLQEVVQTTPPPDVVDLAVETSSLKLVGDRGQLAEVMTNLVTNAYQAVPDGGTVRVRATEVNGSDVVVTVEDSGPGIDADLRDRMFEPFFTTKASGTGLGLAIVRRLVEAHGGEISIENGSARGARVTVRLPVDGGASAKPTSEETS